MRKEPTFISFIICWNNCAKATLQWSSEPLAVEIPKPRLEEQEDKEAATEDEPWWSGVPIESPLSRGRVKPGPEVSVAINYEIANG